MSAELHFPRASSISSQGDLRYPKSSCRHRCPARLPCIVRICSLLLGK